MELKVIAEGGKSAPGLAASDALFGRDYNEALVHQLVVAYQANARSGNRAQKGRSDVAKSTRKPFKQKGTGNARSGMASSPLWRGGGKIFPSSPDENFSHKVNRKMFRAGVATILSQLVREERLMVVDGIVLETPKTKEFIGKIASLGLSFDSLLIVTDVLEENLYLSSRNLPHVLVLEAQQADPVSLVGFKNILVTAAAVKKFEEMWG